MIRTKKKKEKTGEENADPREKGMLEKERGRRRDKANLIALGGQEIAIKKI